MFEKGGYDTWQIRMLLYIEGKENVHMLLDSLLLGPFKVKEITIPANDAIGHAEEKCMQTLADLTSNNKTIMGYDIKLADEFDRFTFEREEMIQSYYIRFAKLINDINIIGLHVTKFQINIKFVNQLQPEWSRFITRVKQARNLHDKMDDPNITMEEYVWYETEKALRNCQMYNWETANYDDSLSSQHVDDDNWKYETSLSEYDYGKYNAISDKDLFSYNIFDVIDLKPDKDNGEDKIVYWEVNPRKSGKHHRTRFDFGF
ncbi:hypothetical protein Tco_0585307 [Tanacetum coccineum]